MKRLIGGLAAAVMVGGAGHAEPVDLYTPTPGYIYFNRPGADMATHDSELGNCAANWEMGYAVMRQNAVGAVPYMGNAIGYGVGLAIAGAIQSKLLQPRERARYQLNVEHCMAVRGWRVVRVTADEGALLAQLPQAELAATLTPWIGASAPQGEIARVWGNEIATADVLPYHEAKGVERTSLSELAANTSAPPPPKTIKAEMQPTVQFGRELKAVSPDKLSSVPLGSAVLIVKVLADSRPFLAVGRAGPSAGPSVQKAGEIVIRSVGRASARGEPGSKMAAFVVPPGKWRLDALRHSPLSPCMGSPAFEVRAGEVIFLGTFDFTAETIGPDMNTAPAENFLRDNSALAARLTPAAWINGSTSICAGWYPYAVEFDGFPFEGDYTWGSRARR